MDFIIGSILATVAVNAIPYIVNGIGSVQRPERVNLQAVFQQAGTCRPVIPYRAPRPYTGGRVKALFIGINYRGTQSELSGCVNDCRQMLATLQRIEFPITECCILVDDPSFPNFTAMPTRENILKHMAWLVYDVRPGDVLFFHFSGHGSQTKAERDSEEENDQCLIPVDYKTKGAIIDDDLFNILVRPLPPGVRLTAVFDCCHSASLLDLPFAFTGNRLVTSGQRYEMNCVRRNNFSNGDVVMFSGCQDSGTSADVSNTASFGAGSVAAGGAATQAFTWTLLHTAGLHYLDILRKTRDMLRQKKYKQIPQLSSSKPLDLHKPFSLFGSITVNQNLMQHYQHYYKQPQFQPVQYNQPPPHHHHHYHQYNQPPPHHHHHYHQYNQPPPHHHHHYQQYNQPPHHHQQYNQPPHHHQQYNQPPPQQYQQPRSQYPPQGGHHQPQQGQTGNVPVFGVPLTPTPGQYPEALPNSGNEHLPPSLYASRSHRGNNDEL